MRSSPPRHKAAKEQKASRIFIGRREGRPIQAARRQPAVPKCELRCGFGPTPNSAPLKTCHKKFNHPRRNTLFFLPLHHFLFPPSPKKSLSKLTNRDIGLTPNVSITHQGITHASGESPRTKPPSLGGVRQRAAIEARLTSCGNPSLVWHSRPRPSATSMLLRFSLTPGLGRGWGALRDEDMSPCVPGLDRPGAVEVLAGSSMVGRTREAPRAGDVWVLRGLVVEVE